MKVALNKETLKYAGGAIIVAAAVGIMMPDLVKYLAGLWRLGVMIAVVITLAWLLAFARHKLTGQKAPASQGQAQAGREGDNKEKGSEDSV